LAITDLDLVILDCGCSTAARDGVGVSSLFSSVDAGVDWKKKERIRNWGACLLGIRLTSDVELFDLPPSKGLSEKSFAITLHIEPRSLAVDLFGLEGEFLLFGGGEIQMDILLFSLFCTKAAKPLEPIESVLSLFGFHVAGSVGVGSGLSGIVSWTTSRSSESRRPTSETLPKRDDRDFPPVDRVMIASSLSLLSSSRGVGRVEKLDAVMVGDKAGELDFVVNECMLSDLPRVTSSAFCLASLVVMRLMTIGGGRLFSRGEGVGGSSDRLTDDDKGESGRGTLSEEGTGGSFWTVRQSVRSKIEREHDGGPFRIRVWQHSLWGCQGTRKRAESNKARLDWQ